MAERMPVSASADVSVNGVGMRKLERFGKNSWRAHPAHVVVMTKSSQPGKKCAGMVTHFELFPLRPFYVDYFIFHRGNGAHHVALMSPD